MLKRNIINTSNINTLNANIEAYQIMIQFYEDYNLKNNDHEYINQRIQFLYNELSEYLIAKQYNTKIKNNTDLF